VTIADIALALFRFCNSAPFLAPMRLRREEDRKARRRPTGRLPPLRQPQPERDTDRQNQKGNDMSVAFNMTASQGPGRRARMREVAVALKRLWMAYITWRMQQAAALQLSSLSDRTLHDMGLTRSEIPRAVKRKAQLIAPTADRRSPYPGL
jgi:uncharacterized protein YjiS (DUF1127 family)